MKKLIVVRHGSYGDDLRISVLGREQMACLARKLKAKLHGLSVRMLTSSAPRAADSAEVLADELEIEDVEQYKALWSDNRHPRDNAAALALIREKSEDIDVLIVVTHLEYAEILPTLFGREALGVKIYPYEISKGECRVILCDEKIAIVL